MVWGKIKAGVRKYTRPYKWPFVVQDGAGQYVQLPTLTTTQRNALTAVNGQMIYNSTTTQFEVYQAGSWKAMDTDTIDYSTRELYSDPLYSSAMGSSTTDFRFIRTSALANDDALDFSFYLPTDFGAVTEFILHAHDTASETFDCTFECGTVDVAGNTTSVTSAANATTYVANTWTEVDLMSLGDDLTAHWLPNVWIGLRVQHIAGQGSGTMSYAGARINYA